MILFKISGFETFVVIAMVNQELVYLLETQKWDARSLVKGLMLMRIKNVRCPWVQVEYIFLRVPFIETFSIVMTWYFCHADDKRKLEHIQREGTWAVFLDNRSL